MERSDLPDQDLVEQLKAGEESAFEVLLDRYQSRVYRLVRSITKSAEDAEETLQDVFLSVYRKIASFDGRSAFGTWLYRIAVNAALMTVRDRGPIQESIEAHLPQFTEDGRHVQMIVDWAQGAEDQLLQKERVHQVRQAVEALPPDYRAVIVLRDLEGLSNEEAAEVVGISLLAVKSRLHRARLALRDILERQMTEPRRQR